MTTPLLQPALALMVLTALVWLVMYARRLNHLSAQGTDPQAVLTPEAMTAHTTESVARASNNLKNLFELPVLFYALCLVGHVTDQAGALLVALAWTYVGLRAVHSAIHCTVNIVKARFVAYLASSLVLWVMLVLVAAGVN